MKILILGASSYVGARLYFDLKKDFETTGTFNTTPLFKELRHLDIKDELSVKDLFEEIKPEIVLHVANYANPRWCEANPEKTKLVNETATNYIVAITNSLGAKLVYISAAVAAHRQSTYSLSKFAADEIVLKGAKDFVILKPHTVVGFSPNTFNDRMFNRFLKNLDEGVPAIYDTGWKFQPSYLGHLSKVIKLTIERDLSNETIPVVVDCLKSRFDLAHDILTPFGMTVTPIDKHDAAPVVEENVEALKKLQLPTYEYEQMIEMIVEEIKNRKIYELGVNFS